jgi:hypothetical protein
MSTWNWVQLAVAIVVAAVGAIGKGMNKWIGFFMILGAGILMIVMSIISRDYRFLPLGIWAIVSDFVALADNAVNEAQADDDTLGGSAKNIRAWAWVVIAVLFVAALVVTFLLPAPPSQGGVPGVQSTEQEQSTQPKGKPQPQSSRQKEPTPKRH